MQKGMRRRLPLTLRTVLTKRRELHRMMLQTRKSLLRQKHHSLVAVELEDVPGALGGVLDRLASCDLNVEYAYGCSVGDRAVDVIKVTGEPLEVKLAETGLRLLSGADLYVVDED